MTTTDRAAFWRRCSSCKTELPFAEPYFRCSVSTCNRKRTGFVFCSVGCWEAHRAGARHRDAWAEEARSPEREQWEREQAAERERLEAKGKAGGAGRSPAPAAPLAPGASAPREVLVVMTKLKAFVKERSGMATSDRVAGPLSDHLRELCDGAIERAAADGRRTVMARDLETAGAAREGGEPEGEILVVVSKVKQYIRARSGMSTSDGVMPVLSSRLRQVVGEGIRNAARDDRRTVMDRDLSFLWRS